MSTVIRVIPCLDVNNGRVVKGVNFENLRDAGDPAELAHRYNSAGADEITFLDVTATTEQRDTTYELVNSTAKEVFIPLTVGGGIRSVEHVDQLLRNGADKVSISSAAVSNPDLLNEISSTWGAQVLVLSLDAQANTAMPSGYEVMIKGGKEGTGMDAIAWVKEVEERGVGEILINSIDADGTRDGFDLDMIKAVRAAVSVPLIASGGAGEPAHFPPAIEAGAQAVLAASLFHYGPDDMISQVKDAIEAAGFTVRR
ncbi:MAG: imidazole glycerol phosphate synthase subunit HisF [Yaniella sp.]|uniref:imidazole glycerol phosphate synthase subunit HisF n=1 Tax=Yaniella sp. TaxID=2773929 RepID=UPI002648DCE9|nr:imidazole glycerol phosphate synthase subunit HisF [Yaniella sp.]MDN5730746.1 imidazole glycerol phosphate synthase subunit HisF [Yaniella sp.]MDN5742623.1 imidazole glycerol phosphate synthase subunit HisF [Yaniella sp.]MDN5814739.1 imidazole glycerol phosphate synthase subunit HisF [Yaniella sp.]MDN5817489.1 imidazole glycerol phosphate synthase subunit HisF [Yaniella sp.]MDN5837898.1 imidazole glycerol phosphate synthase subunit HisF [Yaniella sp.]